MDVIHAPYAPSQHPHQHQHQHQPPPPPAGAHWTPAMGRDDAADFHAGGTDPHGPFYAKETAAYPIDAGFSSSSPGFARAPFVTSREVPPLDADDMVTGGALDAGVLAPPPPPPPQQQQQQYPPPTNTTTAANTFAAAATSTAVGSPHGMSPNGWAWAAPANPLGHPAMTLASPTHAPRSAPPATQSPTSPATNRTPRLATAPRARQPRRASLAAAGARDGLLGSPQAALADHKPTPAPAPAPAPPAATVQGAATPPGDDHQHFPIRASVQNRALGLRAADPLLEGVTTAVAGEFAQSLGAILRTADDAAADDERDRPQHEPTATSLFRAPSTLTSTCRGATGIGGALVPGGAKTPAAVVAEPRYEALPATTQEASPPASAGPVAPPTTASGSPVKEEPGEGGFKTTFQFVVNETTKDARNTVRKHVMREYRRRERWEQHRRRAAGDGTGASPPPGTTPKRRRKSNKAQQAAAAAAAAAAPAAEGDGVAEEAVDATMDGTMDGDAEAVVSSQEAGVARAMAAMSSSSGSEPSPDAATQHKRRRLLEQFLRSKGAEMAAALPEYEEALAELSKNQDLPYMADPYAAVAASDVDPFSRMQMELGPATRSLLHHFAWVMPSLMDEIVTGTVFNRLGWLYSAVAVHDPQPAHVILGFTLGHLASLRGVAEPAVAIEHKNRAVGLINSRMANPAEAMSDDNIGAVVNIAGWELIDCNPEAFALHMKGLHQMLTARGGITALAHRPELQTVLVRLDAIRAYIALSAPRYPTYACFRTLPALAVPVPASASNPTIPPLAAEHPEYAFCEDTLYLLHTLEDALLLFRTISKESPRPTASLQELIRVTMQHCLAPDAVQPSRYAHHRSRLVARLAALVFVDAAMQHFFDGDAPDKGAKRLTATFLGRRADKNAMAAWGRSLEMVIHVLLAADRLALERPWRGWYFADALTLTMKLSEEAWGMVEKLLRDYLVARCAEAEKRSGTRSESFWQLKAVYDFVVRKWEGWVEE